MTKRRNRSTLVKLVPLALALLASSCASLERNVARSTDYRKQANDSLTGGGQILLSAFRATAVAGVGRFRIVALTNRESACRCLRR